MTDDPGMKDMLSYLVAQDTMHKNQWMAALEGLGGAQGAFPIPTRFPQTEKQSEFSCAFQGFQANGGAPVDGPGQLTSQPTAATGQQPDLGPARTRSGARTEQM